MIISRSDCSRWKLSAEHKRIRGQYTQSIRPALRLAHTRLTAGGLQCVHARENPKPGEMPEMQKGCGGGGGGCCAVLQGLTKQLKHCGVVCQCCRVWDALTGNSFLTSSQCSLLQFERVLLSSVQDGIYALRKAHVHSDPSLRSFPNVAFEMVPTTNNGPLLSFQGRSSRTSSFHASLLQAIGGVRS